MLMLYFQFFFVFFLIHREFVRDCFLKLIPATDITYQGVYQKQFKVSWSVSSFFQLFLAYSTNTKSQ